MFYRDNICVYLNGLANGTVKHLKTQLAGRNTPRF